MLHVIPGETVLGPNCSCCERAGRSAFGFVHRGDMSVAFYYAWLAPPHEPSKRVSMAISIGDWSREEEDPDKQAAALRFERSDGEVAGQFVESSESPFADRDVLGPFLTIEELSESVLRR